MAAVADSPIAAAPRLADALAGAEPLTLDERHQVVHQAQLLIEQVFVHLPLKRAMHAVDPVQKLRLLDRRLRSLSDRRFHDEMIAIFVGLRDMHTNYLLPQPFARLTAVLPFRIEAYWDGDERRYLVSAVAPGLDAAPFAPGVEATHWNGIPIERAVALNGDRNAGSNAEARHARGLATMTQRPMRMLAAPDEEWVDLAFVAGGRPHDQRFAWQVVEPAPAPASGSAEQAADPVLGAVGLDILVEDVRRAQKTVLAPDAIGLEAAMAADGAPAAEQLTATSTLPDALEFRTVQGPRGELGYLRIRTFSVEPSTFVAEVERILGLLPQDGLIVDVRGNGGGYIAAGELLLQLFTPRRIEPEQLHFICTPLTLEATSVVGSELEPWGASIGESVETGAPFSDGLPLAADYADTCNSIGQVYHGPVALIIDALCYSTTDIFAAGFQDHEIGPVVGTSGNTGAGGANVWDQATLQRVLPNRVKPLPKEAAMRVAARRTTRVGRRAGDPVEDLGVVPDHVHKLTRRDLLEQNSDLIAATAELLAQHPLRELVAEATHRGDAADVALTTTGLDRVDAYVDGRPRATLDVTDGDHALSVALAGATRPTLELRGFADGQLVASRRLQLA